MKKLIVIGISANFHTGVLLLSDEQARARSYALKTLGDGLFEIVSPVQFKRGEVVGFEGPVNKAQLQEIQEIKEEEGQEEDVSLDLDKMEKKELLIFARELDLDPHPNTGADRLREMIKERQDEMLAAQEGE